MGSRSRDDSPKGMIKFEHYTKRKDIVQSSGHAPIVSYLDHDSNHEYIGGRKFNGYSKREANLFLSSSSKTPAVGVYYPKYNSVLHNNGQGNLKIV